jgi:formate dehydrogenase subunit delta
MQRAHDIGDIGDAGDAAAALAPDGAHAPTVRLAHDIARQFSHLPDPDAARAIATHINSFWDPSMRDDLLRRARSGEPLDHDVAAAVALIRA